MQKSIEPIFESFESKLFFGKIGDFYLFKELKINNLLNFKKQNPSEKELLEFGLEILFKDKLNKEEFKKFLENLNISVESEEFDYIVSLVLK